MKFTLAAAALPLLAVAAPAGPAAAPPSDKVVIRDVKFGGTGCPSNTVSHSISKDGTTVTVLFDNFVASIGPQIPITDNRKNCQLHMDLLYPGGFQFSVFNADYRGYTKLDKGVTATLKSNYYFSGDDSNHGPAPLTIGGAYDGDYQKSDVADTSSVVWSPCGAEGLLNINSQIRLASSNKTASGILTTDSIDAKFTQVLNLKWQTCKQ